MAQRGSDRWPAIIVDHKQFNAKVDFNPKTGAPHGVMIWRTDKTTHDIDDDMDALSRKISRVMQKRST